MGPINNEIILTAAMNGVKKAIKDYMKISGDFFDGTIPESYYQSKIADQIARTANGSCWITLEDTYAHLVEWSEKKATKKKLSNSKQRADITVWYKQAGPRFVVEVKKARGDGPILSDCRKLRELMKYSTSLQAGLIVAKFHSAKRKTVKEQIERLAFKMKVEKYESTITAQGDYYVAAAVFMVK